MKFRETLKKQGKSDEELDRQFRELEEPNIPLMAEYILQVFFELNGARQTGMNGPLPISYVEIKAYVDLKEEILEPWEVDFIKHLDRVFLEEYYKMQSKE